MSWAESVDACFKTFPQDWGISLKKKHSLFRKEAIHTHIHGPPAYVSYRVGALYIFIDNGDCVICCHIINCPKTLWHKTVNTYYPTQFLWFRNPGRTLLGGSAYGLSWDYSQDVARCTVLESLNEAEGATSKVADSLARQICVTCRKEALVPHHVELSLRMVECPHNMAAGDPRERATGKSKCISWLPS